MAIQRAILKKKLEDQIVIIGNDCLHYYDWTVKSGDFKKMLESPTYKG